MGFFHKKNNISSIDNSEITDFLESKESEQEKENDLPDQVQEPEIKEKPEEVENWVWADGYKCIDKNMRGYNNFQYKLNKQYDCEGKIQVASNGFHFCKDINSLCFFGNIKSGRMFKVRALYNINDKDSVNQYCDFYQYVAKSIILVDELDTKTIWNLCSEQLIKPYEINQYEIQDINSYDDFIKIREIGIDKFRYNNLFSKYKEIGFSDTFITVFLLDDFIKNTYNDIYNLIYYNNCFDKAKSLIQEGLSKDMIVYLLLKDKGSK